MKITKLIHSSLLIEDKNIKILIDQGKYGYTGYPTKLNTIKKIDYLLITHTHGDHMHIPFITELIDKHPGVTIISNSTVQTILAKENIAVTTRGNTTILLTTTLHESSFDKEPLPNTIFTLFDTFLHPGDTIEYPQRAEIMALPIDCGMWGKVAIAVERLVALKPKYIIPIHDYRLRDEIKKHVFKRMETYFKSKDIAFIPLNPGETISIHY